MFCGSPIKILAQGYTAKISAFRNIVSDIPFLERKAEEASLKKFCVEQNVFNSAESFNQIIREKYSSLPCYSFPDFLSAYLTTSFINYKLTEISSVSEYLLKIISVIESVLTGFICVRNEALKAMSDEKIKSEELREFIRTKNMIHGLVSLFPDVLCAASDLENDKNNIEVPKVIYEMKEFLRLSFAARHIPDEVVPSLNSIFPAIPLSCASEFEYCNNSNYMCHLYSDYRQIEDRIMQDYTFFVKSLLNQFSFYVTPENFLNNPVGRTIFVIPMSMYRKFCFQNSGLYKNELPQYVGTSADNILHKQSDFLKELKTAFSDIYEQSEKVLFRKTVIREEFTIRTLIELYLKKHPVDKLSKIQTFIQSPIVFEKMTEMIWKNYKDMIEFVRAEKDPWAEEPIPVNKERDRDIVYFLLRLYDLYPESLSRFPQAEFLRFFNIFNYSKQPVKCMNAHVRKYYEGKYKVSKNYEKDFGAILKR